MEVTAPIITFARHRMGCDGQGITTLVLFHGCPLRCRWCLNDYSHAPDTPRKTMTPRQLYEQVRIDDLYFLATGGGVTFGGGEPLLYPDFLVEFKKICPERWQICVETSLAVPWEHVEKAASVTDVFYIDCKDTDPEIYRRYTGGENTRLLENLPRLPELVPAERIVLRLPLIPGYNTEEDRQRSMDLLRQMGFTRFDTFTYTT